MHLVTCWSSKQIWFLRTVSSFNNSKPKISNFKILNFKRKFKFHKHKFQKLKLENIEFQILKHKNFEFKIWNTKNLSSKIEARKSRVQKIEIRKIRVAKVETRKFEFQKLKHENFEFQILKHEKFGFKKVETLKLQNFQFNSQLLFVGLFSIEIEKITGLTSRRSTERVPG